MTDRELLELAAKAAALQATEWGWADSTGKRHDTDVLHYRNERGIRCSFVPLTDDGDALRLAVKLAMNIEFYSNNEGVYAYHEETQTMEIEFFAIGMDEAAATRRAIVRAAAQIGKAMERT